MTTATVKPTLLPIGTRVTHFSGELDSTHGKGTIIAYNGINPNEYLKSNFKEAVEMAGDAGLLGGLIDSLYDKTRCPYVVHFDLHPAKLDKYPKGYKDVYEHDSVREQIPAENIFPSKDVSIMMRLWSVLTDKVWSMADDESMSVSYPFWTNWAPVTHDEYQKLLRQEDPNMQFCIRSAS